MDLVRLKGGNSQRIHGHCCCTLRGGGCSCSHRIGKVEGCRKSVVVIRRYLSTGMEFQHQMRARRHHVLLLNAASGRELFHNLVAACDVVQLFPTATLLHLEEGYKVRVAVCFWHLHARETDADARVGGRGGYKVPAHHVWGIYSRKSRTSHSTGALCAAIKVVVRPVAFCGSDPIATLRMKAHNRMAERRKAVVSQKLRLPLRLLCNAVGGWRWVNDVFVITNYIHLLEY